MSKDEAAIEAEIQAKGLNAPRLDEQIGRKIGRKIARDNARGKIWALEGYLLRQRLADAELARVTGGAIV